MVLNAYYKFIVYIPINKFSHFAPTELSNRGMIAVLYTFHPCGVEDEKLKNIIET
jgi:hypothetical protein